jgi:hypothetical protein
MNAAKIKIRLERIIFNGFEDDFICFVEIIGFGISCSIKSAFSGVREVTLKSNLEDTCSKICVESIMIIKFLIGWKTEQVILYCDIMYSVMRQSVVRQRMILVGSM